MNRDGCGGHGNGFIPRASGLEPLVLMGSKCGRQPIFRERIDDCPGVIARPVVSDNDLGNTMVFALCC